MNESTAIQALLDKDAVREVRLRFGRALDTRDWALFASLFTDEIDADYSAFGVPARRMPKGDLVAFFQHAFRAAGMRTMQLYSNFMIDLRGDAAHCVSYLHGHHHTPGFAGGEVFEIRAAYHDRLLRTADGWKLAGIRLEVISILGNVAMVS